ncbi:MAG: CoA transferase [Bdellovibrionales bacterium]|nr:CoA transferase [Ramlibacter sp.]
MTQPLPHQYPRPLEGIRVLDLTVALAGPYATLMLGGMGAEVIRVEQPGGGDIARDNPPFVGKDGVHFGSRQEGEVSLTILNRARNKKSITLDLKQAKGRQLLARLAVECDVVVENMSEGTAARLGADYETLSRANPRIVYCSINSLGDPSAYPGLKGMDIIAQALSGLMEVTGAPHGGPTRVGVPVGDLLAPVYAVNGILAALIQRGRTGEGQHVKVSMLDCLASWVAEEHFDVVARAGLPTRSGNFHDRLVPFGIYKTTDGAVAIAAFQPAWMKALMEAMSRPELLDDPRFNKRGPRMANATALNQIVQEWTRGLTADAVVEELFTRRNVPAARVRKPQEVLGDPHLHSTGALTQINHPLLSDDGAVGMGLPIQFSKAHAQFDKPAVELGASNAQIYADLLGLTAEQLAQLKTGNVI